MNSDIFMVQWMLSRWHITSTVWWTEKLCFPNIKNNITRLQYAVKWKFHLTVGLNYEIALNKIFTKIYHWKIWWLCNGLKLALKSRNPHVVCEEAWSISTMLQEAWSNTFIVPLILSEVTFVSWMTFLPELVWIHWVPKRSPSAICAK